jgi:hypothetical protein
LEFGFGIGNAGEVLASNIFENVLREKIAHLAGFRRLCTATLPKLPRVHNHWDVEAQDPLAV